MVLIKKITMYRTTYFSYRHVVNASSDGALNAFMDLTLWLGFICQKVKTKPPAQSKKYCGFVFNTLFKDKSMGDCIKY